jgi:hypothetical protein
MSDLTSVGRLVLLMGLGLVVLGALLWALGRVPGIGALGRLPGDIRIETGNVSCFIPIVSMLLLSLLLTVVLNVVIRLLNR